MHEAFAVGVLEGVAKLQGDGLDEIFPAQVLGFGLDAQGVEAAAIYEFHYHERQFVGGFVEVVELDDVLMGEPPGAQGFLAQFLKHARVRAGLGREELERHCFVEALVLCLPHHALAAFAEQPAQGVAATANNLAGLERGQSRLVRGRWCWLMVGVHALFLFHDCLFANFFAFIFAGGESRIMGIQISYQFKGRWKVRQFGDNQVVIGRPNSQCSVDIDLSPDTTVSRLHARVWSEGDKLWVEDMDSRYGTLVNDKKLIGRTEIQAGDPIVIGETTLKVDDLPAAED